MLKIVESKEIGQITAQDIYNEIVKLTEDIDKNWIKLSKMLLGAYESGIYEKWGFDSFREFVEQDLKLEYRTVMYKVKIAKTIRDLDIDDNMILDIGWTKFKELIPYLSEDQEKNEELFELARELSVRELKIALKQGNNRKAAVLKITFSFNEEQSEIINEAFELAGNLLGTQDKNRIFEAIVSDWLANNSNR